MQSYKDIDEIAYQKAQLGRETPDIEDDLERFRRLPVTQKEKDWFFNRGLRQIITAGKRQKRWLMEKLEDGEKRSSKNALTYTKAELQFVEFALEAIDHFTVELEKGKTVVLALARIVGEVRNLKNRSSEMEEVLKSAEDVLGNTKGDAR